MGNSGSFRGWTSPSQQLFLPKVYWNSESVVGGWNVEIYVNADCYDVAINPLDSWQTTISIAGQQFNPSAKGLFYDGKPRTEIRWVDPFTVFIPSSSGSSQTLDLHIHFKAFEQYAGVHLTDVYASQNIDLGIAIPEYTQCGAPTILYLSKSSNGQYTTSAKIGEKVVLSWTAGAPGTNNPVTGYKVQYSVGEGWVDLVTLNTSVTTYIFKYAYHKKNSFRIQTIGAVEGYDSDWSQTFSYNVENSPPTISNLISNREKVAYNSGNGSNVTFQWNSSDIDKDSLSYNYLIEYTKDGSSKQISGTTSLKSISVGINGDQGTSVKFSVRAYDGYSYSSYISKSILVNTPIKLGTISKVIYPSGADRPIKVDYSWIKPSQAQLFEIYLEIGELDNNSNFKLKTSKKVSSQEKSSFSLSLINSSLSSIIKELSYYRIKVRAFDGFDYSAFVYSSLNRKNIYPNYNYELFNSFPNAEKIDGTNYWKLENGRIRINSIVYDKVYLNFTFPSDTEISQKKGLPISKAHIFRAEGYVTDLENWSKIATINKGSSTAYEDDIKLVKGSHINYRIVFEDKDGWMQQDDSSNQGILYLKVNTAPIFLNQFSEISRFSTSGTPLIKVYENGEFTIKWGKTTGDTDDEYVVMGENIVSEGLPYLKANGRFKINLEFYKDYSVQDNGYPKDLNGKDITNILITDNCPADSSDITYDSFVMNLAPGVNTYFDNFSNSSKRQKYSNVSIVITAYDTYDLESTNNIYIPIILDFRQKPYFSIENLSDLKDISNGYDIHISENKVSGTENAYTKEGAYMINSGENIRFEIPMAYSPNSLTSKDGEISSYIIYYTESYSGIPSTNGMENILIEIPKEELIPGSDDVYYYDYTVGYRDVNSFVRFGVAARDSGYGNSKEERIQNSLIGDIKIYNSIVMFCRCTNPSLSLDDIDFTGNAIDAEIAPYSVDFTINDLGGSRNFSNSTYWDYRNFERFTNGRKFLLQLLYSEKSNFPLSETGISNLIDLDSTENSSFFYPPDKSQQQLDTAYPWTYTISSASGSYLNPKKNYYVKLRLVVNSSSKNSLVVESLPVFLRSRRPTLSGRKNKIGINNPNPEGTLHVSAESDALNDNNYVILDTGTDRDILFRFNLLNAHMERGTIDCGEIF